MLSILRTIAIIDIAAVAVFAAIGALFGMSPSQTLGAGVIGFAAIGLVLGWRAIVNAPQERTPRRDDWAHLGCDPVAPPLPPSNTRVEPVYRIETKYGYAYSNQRQLGALEPKLLEAPRKELATWHNGTE